MIIESDVTARHLPGDYRLLGALAGIPILEDPRLRYDEMYFGTGTQGLAVGEINHFMYRMKQLDLNAELRAKVIARIRESARKMLGEEDWKVAEG